MAKIIKKIIRWVVIILAVMIIVPAFGALLIRTPKFQTFVVKRFSDHFSKKIGTHISVGNVSYTFFNKLVLYNVLVLDQNQDTLLSARQVSVRVKDFRPAEVYMKFGRIDLYEPDFRMIKDTTGILNLAWYIETLKGDSPGDTTKTTGIFFNEIRIYDGAYSLVNKTDTSAMPVTAVDFSDLRITSIDSRIEDMSITNDTVSFSIRDLSFIESRGFEALNVSLDADIAADRLIFSNVGLVTDSSLVNLELIDINPLDSMAYSDFMNRVRLRISLKRSMISISDLSWFVEPLYGINESIYLSGNISGTVSDMRGRDIELEYSSGTRLSCDFDISGLPSPDNVFMFIDVRELTTRAADIENFTVPGRERIILPPVVHELGKMSFTGNFTGFTSDFVAYGTLLTEKGSFSTDLSLEPEGRKDFRFKGLLKASGVDLASIAKNDKLFGGLWLHANVDGSMRSFSHLSAQITGVIDSVTINRYPYRNISLSGTYTEKVWDGSVSVNDRNLKMDILGRFDLSDTLPEFDFTMNLAHAGLYNLNLEKKDTLFNASALLTATFRGTNIDNLDGDLRLINSKLSNSNGTITIYDFLIRSGTDKGVPLLTLRSDLVDGEIKGQHTYASLGTAVKATMANLFPTRYIMPASTEELKENNFSFNVKVKKVNKLSEFLGNSIRIAEGTNLSGLFNADSTRLSANLRSGAVSFGGVTLVNLEMISSVRRGVMNSVVTSDTLKMTGNATLQNIKLKLGTKPDTLNLGLEWDNKASGKTRGEVLARGFYSLNNRRRPVMTIGILPTEIVIDSALWKLNPARIVIDSATTRFDNLLLSTHKKFIKLDGLISPDPDDRLTLNFEGLDLAFISSMGKKKPEGDEERGLEMNFGGIISGDVSVSDVHKNFLFEADARINDFVVNNTLYGRVDLGSEWNPQRKVAVINVKNDFEGATFFDINGTYSPSAKTADITASTFRMPLNILNSIVKSFASDVRGLGSGKIRLYGRMSQPLLTGSIMAEDASMKIDFLQTRYHFSDSIRFTRKGIEFRNVRILDEKKNQGTLNGMLSHNSFKDFGIDLNLNINRMLVLNTKPKDNETFYGTAYATGYAGIKGTPEKLSFRISARTDDNTSFYIPLSSSATVSEYPYILFIDTRKDKEAEKARDDMFVKKEKEGHMELDFDLEVTPDAEVQLIMDSKAGDVIRGTGAGKLNISLNSKGEVKMSGDYVIEDGDYLFTLGNILNKKFSVEEGGTISWNGDLTDAAINLKAIYRLKASLYDIYPDEAFRDRIPVECQLNLSEKLMNPVIGFNIVLPTADDETREYLKSAINTEEEISRQFLYLLVMNSFYPDPSLYSAVPQTSPQGASAIGVTTTEMLSNQLSNWLSQISNDFDIGFTYRPGNEITPQEVEVALSTQLLNDKVILNGNFDVGGKQTNAQASNITGDFDIEFKITEKLRFKVFNRSNDNLFYETSPYTQGFGFFYRRDFNKLKELFIPQEKKKKKKPEEKEQEEKQ